MEHGVQPVGAEQDHVARQELLLDHVELDRVLGPHRLGDDVAQRMPLDLVGVQDALTEGRGDPGVVAGELGERARPQQVAAAVAGGAHGEHVAAHQGRHRGRAHARVLLPLVGGAVHLLVGELDRGLEPVAVEGEVHVQPVGPGDLLLPVALLDEGGQGLDGHLGGHLARVVAPHAVADRVEVRLGVDEEVVLVQLAAAPDVGTAERLEHLRLSRRGCSPRPKKRRHVSGTVRTEDTGDDRGSTPPHGLEHLPHRLRSMPTRTARATMLWPMLSSRQLAERGDGARRCRR